MSQVVSSSYAPGFGWIKSKSQEFLIDLTSYKIRKYGITFFIVDTTGTLPPCFYTLSLAVGTRTMIHGRQ